MADAAAGDGEDPRWRRSSADCVSFLASRFACTKGTDCEFRHCEGARFSPSCWYWIQGNCVNPSCTFRHPPLESLNRSKPLADPLPSCASASVKAASPCFFYYNSYCKKGGSCPFLHEPPAFNNVVGTCSGATTCDIATVHGNYSEDKKIESSKYALANPYQGSPEHIKKHHSNRVTESSSPVFNGATSNAPETSVDTVGYMKSSMISDQSSGDPAREHAEEDKSRDSSPGFDVLVDDGPPNNIGREHQLAQERDTDVNNLKHYIGDPVVYGLDYHDAEYQEQGLDFERGSYLNYLEGVQGHDYVTTFGHIPHSRLDLVKFTSEEHGKNVLNPRSVMALRADFGNQNTQIGDISKQRSERRINAKGKNGRTKRRRVHEARNGSKKVEQRPTQHMQNSLIGDCYGSLVSATFKGQKKKSRRKQHHARSAGSSNYTNANAKHLDHPEDFSSPKSLAQIKEEKCRSRSSFSHSTVHVAHGRPSSNDFEGPKSLSEILKAKGRSPDC